MTDMHPLRGDALGALPPPVPGNRAPGVLPDSLWTQPSDGATGRFRYGVFSAMSCFSCLRDDRSIQCLFVCVCGYVAIASFGGINVGGRAVCDDAVRAVMCVCGLFSWGL